MTKTLSAPPAGYGYPQRESSRQSLMAVAENIAFADTTPVTLFKVPNACILVAIGMRVTTAFNGAAEGENINILAGTSILLKVTRPVLAQTNAVASNTLFQPLTAGTDITVALDRGNASTGAVQIWAVYRPWSADLSPLEGIK